MALKPTIREKCERCGKRAARKEGEHVIHLAHKCPNAPPGPGDAPRRFRADSVVFEPGEFTADELRAELEEAWATITDFHAKRFAAEDAAKRAVERAIRDVYSKDNETS